MRMVITTGDLEEGAHHISEELYKKVALLLMSGTHPEMSRPTQRAADGGKPTELREDDDSCQCLMCGDVHRRR